MHRLRRIVALLLPLLLLSLLNTQAQIGGQVLETTTGKPIVGANISVPESSIGASSSRSGNFALQWYSFPIQLHVSAIGYESRSVTVFESTSELLIELETKVYLSDEITVSDARIDAQNIRTRPIPVTSVDVANNNFKQNTSSADLLRSEKGVYIQQTSPGQGSVYIRGRAGRDVLYLFNGLRMNPSFVRSGQNQYFGAVDPFTTRQINVFRGPVSVYYGSDALSGGLDVTPIIRSFSTNKSWSGAMVTQANFEGTGERTIHTNTSYTSPRLTFYLGGTARHYSYYRMSSSSESDQWFPYETKISDVDYNFLSYTTSLRYRINERNQLSAVSYAGVVPDAPRLDRMVMGYRTQVDPTYTSPDVAYDSNTSPLMFSAHSISLSSSVQRRFITSANVRLGYHQLKDHRKEIPYDISPDIGNGFTDFTRSTVTRYDKNTSDQYLFSFDVLSTPFRTTLVRMGGDISWDQISSRRYRTNPRAEVSLREELPRYPDGSSYSQMGLFLHVNQNLSPDLWVEGGVRFSYINADLNLEGAHSERGYNAYNMQFNYTTGSLGLTWSPIQYLYFTSNVSTGFRAPNVADLSELGERRSRFMQIPNPSLNPEHTMNVDASVRWINDVLNLELTGYSVTYSDKIESVPTGNLLPMPNGGTLIEMTNRNENSMQLYGIESSVDIKFTPQVRAGFIFNYTYGDLKERNGRVSPVDRIPPGNGRAYVRYKVLDRLDLGIQTRFALEHRRLADSELQDFRISNDGTDGFMIFQLVSNWQVTDNSEIHFFADNLLDSAYREHSSSLDGLGRNVTVRYSYRF